MALSSEDYEAFGVASERFCNEKDFNFPQTEALMAAVFGADRTSPAAKGWAAYWSALGAAEEAGTELPPFPLMDGSSPDVEMADGTAASGSQPVLSNTVLTSAKEDRERERAERKKNGNQHGKGKKKTGRTPSDLMASVFIERQVMNSKNEMKAMYHCIGCDREVRNNTQARNAPHMLRCKLLQREFPAAWKELKNSIAPSAEQVASGDAPAPARRSKKRKLENPAEGRAPVQGITTPSHAESSGSTPTAQHTLDDTWGASSITATRQSIIDYLLLRLIVCCALAFSLCDNGFFIDFCNALCPSYSVPDRSNFIGLRKTLLGTFIHLTLSYDGWSSRKNDEIYTIHVSTPTRMSYMVAGIILTGLSTTGETIFENLKNVLLFYAAVRFSMVVSDTTGNVKKCRALICTLYPWILNCPDPCHQLNLLAKDIIVGLTASARFHFNELVHETDDEYTSAGSALYYTFHTGRGSGSLLVLNVGLVYNDRELQKSDGS
ncbi:hypothetical protein B0H10DRAFT_2345315 [Mycena sp. CBHHK59/15]|nr:hypothetical protein B0H10DRAFT_2345315 [Mycena sp. CBHHK59/15]